MSNRLEYIRKFIIFKKDYGNMISLSPKGHGKLELKGSHLNLSVDIQGAESNNFYNIEFIKKGDGKSIGNIYTKEDKSAKADLNLNYKELEKIGYSIDNIDGIILRRENNVLLGESLKKNTSVIRKYVKEVGKGKPIQAPEQSTKTEESTHTEVTLQTGGETETTVNAEEEQEENNVTPEQNTASANNFSEDMFNEKKYEEIMEEIFHIPELGYEDNAHPDKTMIETDEEQTEKEDERYNYILDILNFFPCSEPLTMNLQGYNWWVIDVESSRPEKNFLPYFNYVMGMNNKSHRFEDKVEPKQLLDKYRHYIFGLYNENDKIKFYIYGIPGKFLLDEHPRNGSTGFNTWFEGLKAPGYWLLYIEPKTGRILYPINPMMPKS